MAYMKKVKVIYNPSAGRQTIQKRINTICNILMNNGYIVGKFATRGKNDAMNETIKCCEEDWDILIACGGDGTINEVATGIVKGKRKIPVAILAAGTVNDFATFMNLPRSAKEFANMIMRENIIDVDLGKVNDKYFVNVLAGGLLSNVAHQVPVEAKTVLGRSAYYIAGLREVPKQMLNALNVSIKSEEYNSQDDVFLFLVTNSSSIGGFKKLAPKAQVEDGLLDCIIIKKCEILDIVSIFISLLKGDHINNPNVVYFKTKKLKISSSNKAQFDIDGEYGGELPIALEVLPSSFSIFT
ncbi:diacylglycerol kinase DagK [Gottschalkia acidurici 9a]|uniref:Diacylglycerol kinase DagK n=1 Tax=Gottschalkia acidurici (strain ATCC 7906 / DSM 604 / BCRC 14475 / CIP 104303 / KCTC 5404 / NCIMB 10678 / 9a) TaxID=1128398 RepID=K0B031_GOTA9|nr:YegS/Rv2252/BmrU family lipid kinase [Gottschalkia acidurici]AFS77996.1 diacylglycerol kinase DagK [Gottschalkia acidurici 9a]